MNKIIFHLKKSNLCEMEVRSIQIVILNSVPLIIYLFANNVICRTIRPLAPFSLGSIINIKVKEAEK